MCNIYLINFKKLSRAYMLENAHVLLKQRYGNIPIDRYTTKYVKIISVWSKICVKTKTNKTKNKQTSFLNVSNERKG